MASSEVGSAYVTLLPSAKGFASRMQRELSGEVAKAGKALGDELGEEVGEEGGKQAASTFGSVFKKGLGKIGALAGGLAIGATLGKGISDALGAMDATAKLDAKLGLTEKQAARAGKVAGTLFGDNYGESMEQVNEAIGVVIQNIDGMRGASEKTLGRISTKALNTANIFDQDLGATTRAVSQMIRTGLAKDADQAFDVLTKGFQSGADKSEDLLDTLNEYGTQFRKLGLDGETATGLLSQGLKAGARDADIVADSIKEFSLRSTGELLKVTQTADGPQTSLTALGEAFKAAGYDANGSSKDFEAAMKMQDNIAAGGKGAKAGLQAMLDGLRDTKDPLARSRNAVALFGTQAEDMGDALYALDPSKAAKGLGQVKGAADKANAAFNNTPTAKIETFKRGLQQGLTNAMANYVIPAIESLTPLLSDLKPIFEKLGGAVKKVATFLKDNATAVGVIAGVLATLTGITLAHAAAVAISSGALKTWVMQTKIVQAVTKTWAAVQWLLNAAMTANPIGLVVVAIVALVAGLILAWKKSETFRKIVTGAFNGLKAAAGKVLGWLGNAVGKVIDWIKGAWKKLTGILRGPVEAAGNAVRTAWDKIKSATTTAWNAVKDAVSKAIGGVVDFVKGLPGKVAGFVSEAWNTAKNITSRLWDGIKNGVSNGITAAINVVKSLKSKVTGALSGAGEWLKNIGKNIIEGLGAGVESMYDWVRDKVEALSGWIPDWVKKRLGIASPSKVMAELGKWIGMGLAEGIKGSTDDVTSALDALNKGVTARLDRMFDGKKLRAKTKQVTAGVKKQYDALRANAKVFDQLATDMEAAKQNLADLVEDAKQYAQSIKDTIVGFGSVVGLGVRELKVMIGETEETVTTITAGSILEDLRARAAQAGEFVRVMQQLTSMNLNQTTLDQLYQAGPEAALATAQALAAGGASAVGEVNTLTTQIETAGTTLGARASDTMKSAAIGAAQSLVNNLALDQAELDSAANKLVSQLVEAMEKATKAVGIDLGVAINKYKPKKKKKDDKTKLASGGRVTGATVALIGEGREPETVLPDSMLRGLLERTAAANSPGDVRVFIGDRELTDIVRFEVDGANAHNTRKLAYGRRVI